MKCYGKAIFFCKLQGRKKGGPESSLNSYIQLQLI